MTDIDAPNEGAAALLGAIAEGKESLADVLGLSPAVLEQLVDKAMGLAKYGKLDEAAGLLEDLAVVDRRSAMLPCLLGTVQATKSDHDAAVRAYGEALLRDERAGSAPRFAAEVRMLRARSSLARGDGAGAKADLLHVAHAGVDGVSSVAKAMLEHWEGTGDADST